MILTDKDLEKMTSYELQCRFLNAVIGSEEYKKISSILSRREGKSFAIAQKTLRWSQVAGIAAIAATIIALVAFLYAK